MTAESVLLILCGQIVLAWACAAFFGPMVPCAFLHAFLNQVKTEFSFSTTAAGEDGTSIKRQPTVKAEMGQSADEKAAVVKAEPVSLEENPSWPLAGHWQAFLFL